MNIVAEITKILKNSIANGDSCIPEAALASLFKKIFSEALKEALENLDDQICQGICPRWISLRGAGFQIDPVLVWRGNIPPQTYEKRRC